MAPSRTIFSLLIFLILTVAHAAPDHNVTEMLSSDPDLSIFSSYLTKTGLADEINSRPTVTVLAVPNSAMSALTSSDHPLSAVKNILSLHVLLDYFDNKKLHNIKDGSVSSTSLYQTTGQSQGQLGQVNITDASHGAVKFGSGHNLSSTYVKEIKTKPYSISVIEVSAPIIVPALLTTGNSDANITDVLDKAGCKTFSSLISSSGVLKSYQNQMSTGITIFAPNDEAFKTKGVPDLSKLSSAELVSLLQYHALTSYAPTGTLKTAKGNLQTLAPAGKYGLSTTVAGDSVTLHTGVDSSRIARTLLDSPPVVIYSVDDLLLPEALFANSPAPAPAPEIDAPTPAPAKAPKAASPAPVSSPAASPPAPPMETPAGSPADSPDADLAGKPSDDKNGAVRGSGSLLMAVVVSVVSGVISLVL